jgi:phosphoenolpyruvate carboxykinase (ATP)
MARGFDLSAYGISAPDVLYDPSLGLLYEDGVVCDGEWITASGALATSSGDRTTVSPRDLRIVPHPDSEAEIDWGGVNVQLSEKSFLSLRRQAVEYFNTCGRLYVVDGIVGWDPAHRIQIRVLCTRPYHALLVRNLLVRPTAAELAGFRPDYVIYDAGPAPADPKTPGLSSAVSISLSFAHEEIVILGTDFAGELVGALFSLTNYLLPRQDVLGMHCAANEGAAGDVSLFFGRADSGKRTLSADPRRKLLGQEQHGWSKTGIFNLLGGSYQECLHHSPDSDPELHGALRFGAILENVVVDPLTRQVAFDDASLAERTHAAYPLEFVPRAKLPCLGGHPANLILLACDAFGVLPPVSRLTPEQAAYYFLSGYTAKISAVDGGVLEPHATFSACFAASRLVRHPTKYAEMLGERIKSHGAQAWLVNTGWTGGTYTTGKRIELAHSRAILEAIHSGELRDTPTTDDAIFGLAVPTQVRGVPSEILLPEQAWSDTAAYRQTAEMLASQFQQNFQAFANIAGPAITAGPRATIATVG